MRLGAPSLKSTRPPFPREPPPRAVGGVGSEESCAMEREVDSILSASSGDKFSMDGPAHGPRLRRSLIEAAVLANRWHGEVRDPEVGNLHPSEAFYDRRGSVPVLGATNARAFDDAYAGDDGFAFQAQRVRAQSVPHAMRPDTRFIGGRPYQQLSPRPPPEKVAMEQVSPRPMASYRHGRVYREAEGDAALEQEWMRSEDDYDDARAGSRTPQPRYGAHCEAAHAHMPSFTRPLFATRPDRTGRSQPVRPPVPRNGERAARFEEQRAPPFIPPVDELVTYISQLTFKERKLWSKLCESPFLSEPRGASRR